MQGALKLTASGEILQHDVEFRRQFPFGAVICTARVAVVVKQLGAMDSRRALIDCEKTARFGLILDNVVAVDPPVFCKGRQGIFWVEI